MNRTANEWSGVKVEAVFGGSEAQARNVLKMALADIAELASDRDRTERNRDMWKGQVERQSESLTELRQSLREVCMMLAARPDMSRLMGFGEKATYERARAILNGEQVAA